MKTRKEKITEFQKGEITLAEAFDVTPGQEAALISLGYTFFSQGKLDDARNILEGIAVLNTKNVYVQSVLGSIYQKNEDYDTAIAKYTEALQLQPRHTYSLANRGEILLRLGRFQEASIDLLKAIESDSSGKHPGANRARFLATILQDALKAV